MQLVKSLLGIHLVKNDKVVFFNLRNKKKPWVISLNSIIKLKMVAAIFPGNYPTQTITASKDTYVVSVHSAKLM